jgi:tetratricopeptide (TPR) repeat protein
VQDLLNLAQAKVDEAASSAVSKKAAPDTISVTLPGLPAAGSATPSPVPEAKPAVAIEAPPEAKPEVKAAVPPKPKPEKVPEPPQQSPPEPLKPVTLPAALPKPTRPAAPAAAGGGETAAAFYRRGHALVQEEHFADAIPELDQALKLDPTLALAYNARGYANFRLKHLSQALADFDVAILLNPAYANAFQNRSAARRASGDAAGAEADAAKVRELAAKPAK